MNIECGQEVLDELEHAFKFNDAVLRHLIIQMKEAVTTPSPMMREDKARAEGAERKPAEAVEVVPAPAVSAPAPATPAP
jgi:small subunit ribosomal protein S6